MLQAPPSEFISAKTLGTAVLISAALWCVIFFA